MPGMAIEDRGYAHPDRLVSTDWVAEHLDDPKVILAESNEDALLYSSGHIPGAFEVDWTRDLNDPIVRDYLNKEAFEALLSRIGWTPDSTVVFYGDKSNWWATYALWVFSLYGVHNTAIMDGGRAKWVAENRPTSTDRPAEAGGSASSSERDDATERALKDDVLAHQKSGGQMIDVRSPQEFSGERMHMPDYPNEGALRGGHIPGAANVPWARAANEDGTFKTAEELKAIYEGEAGLTKGEPVVTYCRIGERSSHTWFVLKHLLGHEKVRNYDGSWTEWGNSVGVPIER